MSQLANKYSVHGLAAKHSARFLVYWMWFTFAFFLSGKTFSPASKVGMWLGTLAHRNLMETYGGLSRLVWGQVQGLQLQGCKGNSKGMEKVTTFHNCSKARTSSGLQRGRAYAFECFFLPKNPAGRVWWTLEIGPSLRTFHYFFYQMSLTTMDCIITAFGFNNILFLRVRIG